MSHFINQDDTSNRNREEHTTQDHERENELTEARHAALDQLEDIIQNQQALHRALLERRMVDLQSGQLHRDDDGVHRERRAQRQRRADAVNNQNSDRRSAVVRLMILLGALTAVYCIYKY